MSTLHKFQPGNFECLEGGFPYSSGVIASPGYHLVRARFAEPPDVSNGFEKIAQHLGRVGRPLTALCAVELRSPQPFTFAGFHEFNVGYVKVLMDWGLVREGLNPVARSNVCPGFKPPSQPVFHAFTYTVPNNSGAIQNKSEQMQAESKQAEPLQAELSGRDYVVAGSGEWPEGQAFPEAIIARDDLSPEGLAAKVSFVMQTMQARCAGLKADWGRLTAAQVYTTQNFHALVETHLGAAGLTKNGLSWHFCKPPIIGLEFEMDVRSVFRELVLPA
jgi:hypothetical protein